MNDTTLQERYILYNKMFNALVVNFYSKSKEPNGRIKRIHINFFEDNNFYHELVLFAANTAATIWGGEIYLNMSLFEFIKWKWPRRKTHKNVHWLRKPDTTYHGICPKTELNFVTKGFEQHISIWWDIYHDFFMPAPADEAEEINPEEKE